LLLSIDPGINNCGIVVLDTSNQFTVVESILVKNARKFTDDEKTIEKEYGTRAVKVDYILKAIRSLLLKYDIDTVVVEAPFYNALTPVAYGSLLEVIFALKYDIIVKGKYIFKLIEPLLVKKMFTSKGMAAKDLIKDFLIKKKEDGSILIAIDIDTLSEHEIDAIAVGFVYNLMLKEGNKNVDNNS